MDDDLYRRRGCPVDAGLRRQSLPATLRLARATQAPPAARQNDYRARRAGAPVPGVCRSCAPAARPDRRPASSCSMGEAPSACAAAR